MISLSLQNIRKCFGNTVAVKDFCLDIQEGELVSLLGPSGCGKTTVLRSIAGFEQIDEGKIYLYNKLINQIPPEHRDVGIVFQSYALFPNMSVADNVSFALMIQGKLKTERIYQVKRLLDLVKLSGFEDRSIRSLSGGQKQRVALARALARQPKVLLLDEPLSALDAKIREELRFEIRKIQSNLGITTVYVTHDQEEALSISDRVVVMSMGEIHQVGSPLEVFRSPQTYFVAGFVGTMNLLHGTIVQQDKFSWEGLELPLNNNENWPDGTLVCLGIRPSDISLIHDQKEIPRDHYAILVEVEPITFLGAFIRVNVRTTKGDLLKIDLPGDQIKSFIIGEKAYAVFPPKIGVLVKDVT
jgi:ABC-type Fe3+/spermidine/putrescine transport system ATPase subunit